MLVEDVELAYTPENIQDRRTSTWNFVPEEWTGITERGFHSSRRDHGFMKIYFSDSHLTIVLSSDLSTLLGWILAERNGLPFDNRPEI